MSAYWFQEPEKCGWFQEASSADFCTSLLLCLILTVASQIHYMSKPESNPEYESGQSKQSQ